jgi:hypothetical protein
MKNRIIKYLLLLAFFCETCAPEKGNSDISGIWYTHSGNPYVEIIIWPEQIHLKNGKSGNNLWVSDWLFYYFQKDPLESLLWDCQSRNDSLLFFNGGARINAHSATLNGDEMHLAMDTIEWQLSRVSEYGAMSEVLQIDTLSWDDVHFQNYLKGYRQRRDLYKEDDASH